MLNGASSEAIAAMAEGLFGLVWGVVIGFFFSWRVALVALALTPLMTIGGAVQAKIDKQDNFQNKEAKEADLLANDCIANYRTVSSFGVGDKILQEFRSLMETPFNQARRAGHISAIAFGYSMFMQNVSFAILFYFGTIFMLNDPGLSGQDVFIAVFAMLFGAFGAGQANSYGPDVGKAITAAIKIFKIIDTPSEINPI